MRLIFLLALALLLHKAALCARANDEQVAQHHAAVAPTLYQNVCASCHGSKGEGRQDLKAPSIAGLPDWYVRAQLENFRNDRRGTHADDTEGQLMRAVSKVLTGEQVQAMAKHIAQLTRVAPTPTIHANSAAGRELYAERCMECHRYNAEGELFFGSPPLVGLQDWYLAAQIRKYQNGIRGVHPKDVNGQKMVFSSGFVETEEMLQSLVAYLMEMQKPKTPDANVNANTAAAEEDPFRTPARKD